MSSAELCRKNGWQVGDWLAGADNWGTDIIEITAIGELAILAKRVQNKAGERVNEEESNWTLAYRQWYRVGRHRKRSSTWVATSTGEGGE